MPPPKLQWLGPPGTITTSSLWARILSRRAGGTKAADVHANRSLVPDETMSHRPATQTRDLSCSAKAGHPVTPASREELMLCPKIKSRGYWIVRFRGR